ncbi:MAG: Rid family hydrolase [Dehalococcoidia bacterium]
MPARIVRSAAFSAPIAPYCNAVRVDDLVFVSGMVGIEPDGRLAGSAVGRPDMGAQTERVLDTIDLALADVGACREDVIALTSFIEDWREIDQYNAALQARYGESKPALATVGHRLAQVGMVVEIEGIAVVGGPRERLVVPNGVVRSPFAQAVRAGDLIALSGMAGVDDHGKVVPGGIRAQTERALENARRALAHFGATPRDVIKTHTTIADWRDFDIYNEVYAGFFGEPYPARASILGTLEDPRRQIEFSMLAVANGERTFVDTATPGRYQTAADRPNVLLDDRLSPGVAPHCQAVRAGNLIAVSGQVATDAVGNLIGFGDVAAQTDAILGYLRICLERLGSSMDDVVKTLVSLVDWRDYRAYNDVYRRFFEDPYPARSTILGCLAQYGLLIEIEAFAVAGGADRSIVSAYGEPRQDCSPA